MFFEYNLYSTISYQAWIILILGIIHLCLPMHKINEFIFPLKNIPETKTYDECVMDFDTV